MKAYFYALVAAVAITMVTAHCKPLPYLVVKSLFLDLNTIEDTLPDLIIDGTATSDWQYVRKTQNFQSQGPVSTHDGCYIDGD